MTVPHSTCKGDSNEWDVEERQCQCLKSNLEADMSLWVRRGGIHLEDFMAGLARGGSSLIHYQIINHTLLRQPNCGFPSRLVNGLHTFYIHVWHRLYGCEDIHP